LGSFRLNSLLWTCPISASESANLDDLLNLFTQEHGWLYNFWEDLSPSFFEKKLGSILALSVRSLHFVRVTKEPKIKADFNGTGLFSLFS
jgi:hypothetical protein